MAVHSNLLRLYKVAGNYRNFLLPRTLPSHQPNAGMKQTLEEKLGLPPKPKKPLTPYFRFLAHVRPTLKQKNPNAKVTEITKLAAEHWEKADPAVRQQLNDEYKHDMGDYLKARAKYEKGLTSEQKEEIYQAREDNTETKERRRIKRKMKELGKPRKPASPFFSFMIEKQSTRGDMPFREFQLKVAKDWETVPEDIKSKYQAETKRATEVYKRELQDWEEKMIRLGHIDVVRNEALIEPKSRSSSRTRRATKGDE